jgi:hypothetical protein
MSLAKAQVRAYRELRGSGVQVSKHNTIKPNAGSETAKHIALKALVAHVGIQNGYRIDSEVVINYRGQEVYCDVLLWGHDSRMSYAVEVEHSITPDTVTSKKEQYVDHTAIDELVVLNATDYPINIQDAYGRVAHELGLNV